MNQHSRIIGGTMQPGYHMPDGSILFASDAAEQANIAWLAEIVNRLASIEEKLDALGAIGQQAQNRENGT